MCYPLHMTSEQHGLRGTRLQPPSFSNSFGAARRYRFATQKRHAFVRRHLANPMYSVGKCDTFSCEQTIVLTFTILSLFQIDYVTEPTCRHSSSLTHRSERTTKANLTSPNQTTATNESLRLAVSMVSTVIAAVVSNFVRLRQGIWISAT